MGTECREMGEFYINKITSYVLHNEGADDNDRSVGTLLKFVFEYQCEYIYSWCACKRKFSFPFYIFATCKKYM